MLDCLLARCGEVCADLVEGRAGLEPDELIHGQGVGGLDAVHAPVGVGQHHGGAAAVSDAGDALDRDGVVALDLVVVLGVLEEEGQDALLLQVGLVDPRDDKIEFCLMHSWATNAYFQPQGCSPSK